MTAAQRPAAPLAWSTGRSQSTTASRLVKPGPKVTLEEAHDIVADLRRLALEAEDHVREFTGLAPVGDPGKVVVVDRPGWAEANVQGFEVLLTPVVDKLAARKRQPGPITRAVGAKVTGVQVGLVLGLPVRQGARPVRVLRRPAPARGCSCWSRRTSSPSSAARGRPARLPALGLPARGHPPGAVHRRAVAARAHARRGRGAHRRHRRSTRRRSAAARRRASASWPRRSAARATVGLIEVVQTPARAARVLDRITAFMSLVEGHAEYVMDAVGPPVIPTVAGDPEAVRPARRKRRQRRSTGCCAGCSASTPRCGSTSTGRAFVRAVVEQVGMDGFNAVWTSPQTLPTKAEIADPDAWVERVLGADARRRSGLAAGGRSGTRRSPRSGSPSGGACAELRRARARRLLAAAPTRSRSPRRSRSRRPRRACGPGWSPSTTACRRARPTQAGRGRRRMRHELGLRPGRGGRGRGRRRRRPGGRGPRRPLRRARRGGRPARAPRRAARPHPRRPGRDGAARAGPRLGRPLARRDARRVDGLLPAPAARRCAGRRPRRPAPRSASTPWDDPHNADPAFAAGRGCAHEVLPLLEDVLRARRRRGAGPHRGAAARRRRRARRAGPTRALAARPADEPAASTVAALAGAAAGRVRTRVLRAAAAARGRRRRLARPPIHVARARRAGDRLARPGTGRPARAASACAGRL